MSDAWSRLGVKEILEDLASRFLVNLPAEEQKSLERICFQVEQALWYYDDFIRPQNPSLPGFHMRTFCQALLRASGIELDGDPATAYDRFLKYKFTVPVCGAIMLNESLDKVVLVKGFKSNASWTFPRGKINKDESERDCAVREVWEETGYDLSPHFDPSVVPRPSTSKMGPAPLASDIDLDDLISVSSGESRLKLFIVPGVPESTNFETRTRREIGKIAWFPISNLASHQGHTMRSGNVSADDHLLGSKFYMVAPAVKPLRAWIKRYRREKRGRITDRSASVSPLPAAPNANQPSFTDVEEANRALQALFFGTGQANNTEPPPPAIRGPIAASRNEAVPGDVKILRRGEDKASSPPGLLDDRERERHQANILSALVDISKADSLTEPRKSDAELIDALFGDAKKSGLTNSPGRRRADDQLLATFFGPQITPSQKPHKASHSPERKLAGEYLLSSLRPGLQGTASADIPQAQGALDGYRYASATTLPLASTGLPSAPLPYSQMPDQVVLPMQPPVSMPFAPPPINGLGPLFGAQPFWPASMPAQQLPLVYQPPTAPVTVSSAGPPLQPTPRRPITLLDNVATPPPPNVQTDADALLSLLNTGYPKPLVPGAARL